MKYLLFGTGDYYTRYKKWFEDKDVAALIDNSKNKQGTYIDHRLVIAPEKVLDFEFDRIVILSFYVKAMRKQLLELGVEENKIYHFYQLHDVFQENYKKRGLKIYGEGKSEEKLKRVLLMSHDLNLGGPSLALMHIGVFLQRIGYDVTFVSMIDGPLVHNLVEKGIRVIVDENLQIQTMAESRWNTGCDWMICNTINYYVFLSERNVSIPVLWWLHDSGFFYDGVDAVRLKSIDRSNLKFVSVGPVPRRALQKFMPDLQIGDLNYFVPDCMSESDKTLDHTKCYFVTIGYIENRKGQDILVDAVEKLPREYLEQCEFSFVGQNTSMLAEELIRKTRNVKQIHILGTFDRAQIDQVLNKSDVLICPSREDPMPTVAAEAMMHRVPCILSDATGTSGYIDDNRNGIIFESGNVNQLSEKIMWCVDHKNELRMMGEEARKIYETHFSESAFEKKISGIISDML